jgi:lipoate-protein ligase A
MHLNILHLENVPIYKQLQLEEALLRTCDQNYCVINTGAPPSIVMGISAKPENVLFLNMVEANKIPVIKRYSGGGTVIVDPDTIFVSFIFQKELLDLPLFPEPIMRWSGEFYKKALSIPEFSLRENDYVIGNKKCAGNAQYIQKNRFVHHTTFLWDFCKENMKHLKMPTKVPKYRDNRPHTDFLCSLLNHLSKEEFISAVKNELKGQFLSVETSLEEIQEKTMLPHRQATEIISSFIGK